MTEATQPPRPREGPTCPLCRDALDSLAQDAGYDCPGCATRYHLACAAELGGCSTLGCRQRGRRPEQLRSWFCRACHEPIESDLTRRGCRCGAYLHGGCTPAHAAACEHGGELVASAGTRLRPSRGPREWGGWFHVDGVWGPVKAAAALDLLVCLLGLGLAPRPVPDWLEQLWLGAYGVGYAVMFIDIVNHMPPRSGTHLPEHDRGTWGFALLIFCPGLGPLIYYLIYGRRPSGE